MQTITLQKGYHTMKEKIIEAREAYFERHPFEPKKCARFSRDEDDLPTGFTFLTNEDDIGVDIRELMIVAMKFGQEFPAYVISSEDVEEWIWEIFTKARSVDTAGVMFAYAFRGIAKSLNTVIGNNSVLRDVMGNISVLAWEKEF